jgi:hypothetical protein
MQRSAGVTVIAILSLLGCVLLLGLAILMMLVPFFMELAQRTANPPPPQPPLFRAMMMLAAFVYVLPAIWGVITAVGLFRLRNWARISTIAFSILLMGMSGFSALATAFVPLPEDPAAPGLATAIRLGMGTYSIFLLAIGVWWLIFFTRPGVKAQFVPSFPAQGVASAPRPGERPASITVIAILFLAGCLGLPFALLMHTPAALFVWVLTGWAATGFYLAAVALYVAIGVGLLRLKPAARLAAIGYLVFWTLNSLVFYLAPGGRERFQALLMSAQYAFIPGMVEYQRQIGPPMDFAPFGILCSLLGLVMLGVMLYFLITRKQAFCLSAPAPAA